MKRRFHYSFNCHRIIFVFDAFLLGIALAMDSLTVSIVNGLKYHNYDRKAMFISSLSFGLFQGLMPLIGYILFIPIITYIERYDHWVVLVVLSLLGLNMIRESLEKEEIEESSAEFTYKLLLFESIATAIDALSSCVVLPDFSISPYLSCFIVFLCTFVICLIGHSLGKKIGLLLKDKAGILGGTILILLGVKCVLEHLNII